MFESDEDDDRAYSEDDSSSGEDDSESMYNESDPVDELLTSDTRQPEFDRDDLKFNLEISRSPWKYDIISYLRKLPITARFKYSWIETVSSLLTYETVLANNTIQTYGRHAYKDPIEHELIMAKLRLTLVEADADADDLEVVNIYKVNADILAVYRNYLSRSRGRDRERPQMKPTMHMIQTTENSPVANDNPTPQRKGGFRIGWR